MRKALGVLALASLCVAQAALAVDDGQTQPKNNTATNNSSSVATDLIPRRTAAGT